MRHPLETFRHDREMTQDQLAKKFSKGTATISRWLVGNGSPTMADFNELQKHYAKSEVMNLIMNWLKWYEEKRKCLT